jgi:hypothetical protein
MSPGYGAGYDAGFLAALQGRAPPTGPPPVPVTTHQAPATTATTATNATIATAADTATPATPATTSFGGVTRTRADAAADDDVPDHLLCCVCFDAPAGRVESCLNGHILCAEAGEGSCLAKLRAHACEQEEQGVRAGARALCPVCRCLLSEAGASTRTLLSST